MRQVPGIKGLNPGKIHRLWPDCWPLPTLFSCPFYKGAHIDRLDCVLKWLTRSTRWCLKLGGDLLHKFNSDYFVPELFRIRAIFSITFGLSYFRSYYHTRKCSIFAIYVSFVAAYFRLNLHHGAFQALSLNLPRKTKRHCKGHYFGIQCSIFFFFPFQGKFYQHYFHESLLFFLGNKMRNSFIPCLNKIFLL